MREAAAKLILLLQVLRLISCSHDGVQHLQEEIEITQQVCERIEKLQICSERASALELALEESTLDSFRALWEAGFLCYDMEFVGTRDLQLIAAHPQRLRWTIEELQPTEVPYPSTHYTIRQLRELGASIFQLPTLDQLLRDLRRRMVDANLHNMTFQDTDSRRPWVFVRLKEPKYTQELLKQVVMSANRHRALSFLVLVVDSQEDMVAIQEMKLWKGKVMRMLPSIGDSEELYLGGDDPNRYTLLGSTMDRKEETFQELRQAGKPMFASGIEEEASLLKALQQGFSGISTTAPVRMQQALHKWRADCKAKEVNPETLPDSV